MSYFIEKQHFRIIIVIIQKEIEEQFRLITTEALSYQFNCPLSISKTSQIRLDQTEWLSFFPSPFGPPTGFSYSGNDTSPIFHTKKLELITTHFPLHIQQILLSLPLIKSRIQSLSTISILQPWLSLFEITIMLSFMVFRLWFLIY